MKVSVTEKSPVLVEIAVELPWEQVEAALNESYARVGRKARIRGFRPGKVPRKLLEHYFGHDVMQEVGGKLMGESLQLAVEQRKLHPVATPQVEPSRIEPGAPFKFKAQVEIRPKMTELVLEGLTGQRQKAEVTDKAVEDELAALRRAHGVLKTIDPPRPAAHGDVVKLDYEVEIDGEPKPDMSTKDRVVELGRGELLPEFEAAVIGARAGESRQATHTFDPEGGRPELRGKTASFTITAKEIQELVLPTLDDEFAKDLGEYETLADLTAKLRDRLIEQSKAEAERSLRNSVIAAFCEKNPVPVPPSMIEEQLEQMEKSLLSAVSGDPRGLRLSDDMRGKLRVEAEQKVRAGLLIMELARQRQITVQDEDLDKRMAELAERTGKNIAKVRADFASAERKDAIRAQIVEEKALDLLLRKATITDVEADAQSPAVAST